MANLSADLLAHVRLLIQDTGTPVVSDVQITNIAKTRWRLVYYEPLTTEDYLSWYYSRHYLEVIALSGSYEGTALTGYTTDALEGSFLFTSEQTAVYFHGYAYDLMDVVANCWLVKAGLIDTFPGMTYSLGDETVSKGEAVAACISNYWRYRTSKGGQLRRR